jgi:hypothetical protein
LLTIFQRTLLLHAFLRLQMRWAAGWLRQLPQAEIQKQKISNQLIQKGMGLLESRLCSRSFYKGRGGHARASALIYAFSNASAIRSHASTMRSLGWVNVMRAYPSPYLPKPIPGVTATPALSSLAANCIESPLQLTQT